MTGGATTKSTRDLTFNRALLSDASGKVAVSSVANTELGDVSGVNCAIKFELNNLNDSLTLQKSMLEFVSGAGYILRVPSTAGLALIITVSGTGATIAQFTSDGLYLSKSIDAAAFDVKANTLSGNCVTQIANIALSNCY